MADGNGSNRIPRVTRQEHHVQSGNVRYVVPVGTALGDMLFDASMFLTETMAIVEEVAGEKSAEICLQADALQGIRHFMTFSKDLTDAVAVEVARG